MSEQADVRPVIRGLFVAVLVFLSGAVATAVAIVRADDGAPAHAGPRPGQRLDEYGAERAEALAGADGVQEAVVSFRRYLADDEVAQAAVGEVQRHLVAVPGGSPEVVTDVAAWRAAQARALREEVRSFRQLLPTVDDPEFEAQYERDLDRARVAVQFLRDGGPVVFGVVVVAPAAELRRLAGDGDVRLVDLVPGGDVASMAGVRPEERLVAGEPPQRP